MAKIDELKSGLFGYKKMNVCEYIAAINEEFSKRIIEKDQINEREMDVLFKKIESLESENKELRRKQNVVAPTVFETKNISESAEESIDIAYLKESVDNMCNSIKSMLQQMDKDMKAQNDKIQELILQSQNRASKE